MAPARPPIAPSTHPAHSGSVQKQRAEIASILINDLGFPLTADQLNRSLELGFPLPPGISNTPLPGRRQTEQRTPVEEAIAAVRAGARITQNELRALLALPPIPDGDTPLRFNDQDILQYHVDNNILTINEIRDTLGKPPVQWGDVTPGRYKATLASLGNTAQPGALAIENDAETDEDRNEGFLARTTRRFLREAQRKAQS